jgi:cGMP-dependent protein kinase 1
LLLDTGIITNSQARFYAASLLLAIEFLQYQNIIHRDIRPENVLVNSKGYIKLSDYSSSCTLKPENRFRTYTIVGSPHYMAPEIMEKRGYSFSVDIWSLGVLIYELICGKLPYGQFTSDPIEIMEAIQTKPLVFPAYLSSNPSNLLVRDLISQMLCKTPERRIGAENFAKIKAHEWFDKYDWVRIAFLYLLTYSLLFEIGEPGQRNNSEPFETGPRKAADQKRDQNDGKKQLSFSAQFDA